MTSKVIAFLILVVGVGSSVFAQESSAVMQLQLEAGPVAAAPYEMPALAIEGAPIKNFGIVVWAPPTAERTEQEGLVFRGGQPEGKAAFEFLKGLGVKTVINLRVTESSDQDLCSANGINCADYTFIPVPLAKIRWHKDFREAFKLAAAEMDAGRKIFIYCQGGRHRTGALASALAIRKTACGKPYNKAELNKNLRNMLKDFGFYNFCGSLMQGWDTQILSWGEDFEDNQWICK